MRSSWTQRAVLCAVIFLAIFVETAGWKSRAVGVDLIPYYRGAEQLLARGSIPDRGHVTSFGAFAPPGTAFLIVPGELLFKDPRLFDLPGGVLLMIAALLATYGISRRLMGPWRAIFVCFLFGLSEVALQALATLWPMGHPAFTMLILLSAVRWFETGHSRYLAAAILIWLAAMYVFIAIFPAIIIVPIAWLVKRARPRLSPPSLGGARSRWPWALPLVAVAAGTALWIPYLRFDAPALTNLRTQMLLTTIQPPNPIDAWCDRHGFMSATDGSGKPNDVLQAFAPPAPVPLLTRAGRTFVRLTRNLTSGLDYGPATFGPVLALVLLMLVGSYLLLSWRRQTLDPARIDQGVAFAAPGRDRSAQRRRLIGFVLIAVALGCNELLLSWIRLTITGRPLGHHSILGLRIFQEVLLIAGCALIFLRRIRDYLRKVPTITLNGSVLIIFASWAAIRCLLIVSAYPERPIRFCQIMPLDLLFMAYGATVLPRVCGLRTWVSAGLALVLLAAVTVNRESSQRYQSMAGAGWAGAPGDEQIIGDQLAHILEAEHRREAAIGYQVPMDPFVALFNVIDPSYKAGVAIDAYLRFVHGIRNTDVCPEGVSPRDEFRIRHEGPARPGETHAVHTNLGPEPPWIVRGSSGGFHLLSR